MLLVLMFISMLICVPKNSLCIDIGHHSFLAADSVRAGIQKGHKHHARGLFHHKKGHPVQDGSSGMVLVSLCYSLNPCICFWPSWRRDAIGNAVTLRIARSFHLSPGTGSFQRCQNNYCTCSVPEQVCCCQWKMAAKGLCYSCQMLDMNL